MINQNDSFTNQVKIFHNEIVELVKKYQFRDRNKRVCCGLSVSQCYIIETLHRFGPLNMKNLADKMHLSISTITRVVAPLVKNGFVQREEDQKDRRIRLITLTQKGQIAFQQSWQNVFESEKIILGNFPAEHRELLISLLFDLNKAVNQWRSCCSKR